ncbi:MAG: hypothetical protein J0L78_03995 [Planctomycetes bacterium]|nr:hypothetical protein [Planctomycetota bacterium]
MNSTFLRLTTLITLAGTIALASCTREYANYPPITGDDFATKNVNASFNMKNAMAAALRWTAMRYPPPGGDNAPFAINLPAGSSEETYERIVSLVGHGAQPISEANAKTLPVYHVTRVWLRGEIARIDIIRPVFEVAEKPGGGHVYRGVEVRLAGGWEPWRVTGSSEYEIGVLEPPALHIPGTPADRPLPANTVDDELPVQPGQQSGPQSGQQVVDSPEEK